MELQAVVKALAGQLLEIGDGLRRLVVVELEADLAAVGLDGGYFHNCSVPTQLDQRVLQLNLSALQPDEPLASPVAWRTLRARATTVTLLGSAPEFVGSNSDWMNVRSVLAKDSRHDPGVFFSGRVLHDGFLFSVSGCWACRAWTTKRCVPRRASQRSWSCWGLSPARPRATKFEGLAPSTVACHATTVRSPRISAKTRIDVSAAGPPGINSIFGRRRPSSRFTRLPLTFANASTGQYLDSLNDRTARARLQC